MDAAQPRAMDAFDFFYPHLKQRIGFVVGATNQQFHAK
jgi:hypothetical protein